MARLLPVSAAAAMLLCGTLASAQPATDAPSKDAPSKTATDGAASADNSAGEGEAADEGNPEGEDELANVVLPEDLRGGHFLIYAGGGFAFMPSAMLPQAAELADVGVGGGGQLQLGIGLNRFLVLGLDGAIGYAGVNGDDCSDCNMLSIGAGLGLAFHPSQAFAFDPWVRYGVGYRYTSASFNDASGTVVDLNDSAIDFAKLSIGGDFYPDPLFGFGPYLETDIGIGRLSDTPQVYANVQLGLRIAFDPMRGGVKVSPETASKSSLRAHY